MNLRQKLEQRQIRWANQARIPLGPPPDQPASQVNGYVQRLEDNLFEPLTNAVKEQLILGRGGELNPPNGESGNMYAVYSSSALCVNLFHHWIECIAPTDQDPGRPADVLLSALGLPQQFIKNIVFEAPNVVNPHFITPPHLDVQISLGEGTTAGIEAKFCEPYGTRRPNGLMPVYLRERALWRDWANLLSFARQICPSDYIHSHLHAAQLIKHLLGLRKQCGQNFVLVYLWLDVPGEADALRHRQEIEHFGAILKSDAIPFLSATHHEVIERLHACGDKHSGYLKYLKERYLETQL